MQTGEERGFDSPSPAEKRLWWIVRNLDWKTGKSLGAVELSTPVRSLLTGGESLAEPRGWESSAWSSTTETFVLPSGTFQLPPPNFWPCKRALSNVNSSFFLARIEGETPEKFVEYFPGNFPLTFPFWGVWRTFLPISIRKWCFPPSPGAFMERGGRGKNGKFLTQGRDRKNFPVVELHRLGFLVPTLGEAEEKITPTHGLVVVCCCRCSNACKAALNLLLDPKNGLWMQALEVKRAFGPALLSSRACWLWRAITRGWQRGEKLFF